jgi:hypothetical protein
MARDIAQVSVQRVTYIGANGQHTRVGQILTLPSGCLVAVHGPVTRDCPVHGEDSP